MIDNLLTQTRSVKQTLFLGLLIVFVVLVIYLINTPLKVKEYIFLAIGSAMVVVGVIEIKKFYWYGSVYIKLAVGLLLILLGWLLILTSNGTINLK